jgi:hypothetical protein
VSLLDEYPITCLIPFLSFYHSAALSLPLSLVLPGAALTYRWNLLLLFGYGITGLEEIAALIASNASLDRLGSLSSSFHFGFWFLTHLDCPPRARNP